jgi:hypothetical protein
MAAGRSARLARLLDQMELHLEDLEADATEDELAAEKAAVQTIDVRSFERRRPSRKPFPEHLPRERVVIAAPAKAVPAAVRRSCRSWARTLPRRCR